MIYKENEDGTKVLVLEANEIIWEVCYELEGEKGYKTSYIENGVLHMEDCPCYDCWAGLVEHGDYSIEPLLERKPEFIQMFLAQGRESWMLEEWGVA